MVALAGERRLLHIPQERVHLFRRQPPARADTAVAGHGGENVIEPVAQHVSSLPVLGLHEHPCEIGEEASRVARPQQRRNLAHGNRLRSETFNHEPKRFKLVLGGKKGLGRAGRERVELSRSEVSFRTIDAHEAAAYWRGGEPADKAGGYGIQGLGALFISALKGSYSGVMGLPLFETARLLETFSGPLLERTADGE